ncbi:MAG: flagellar basal-body rod protein FlgG [Dechloromonas sp.]|uniref:Flagellar basal-body rod protein FlgG n=1 Tax=Candidatus Dechloromonas phosphorivorans TaxID=2899244 RepID=A0A9D7LP79_9RHOO|nr:flagellar basal-body rod protein FlgG [Candidatus Dechloromonas phosphorivorans]
MIQALWIGKTGLEAQQVQLDVIANNLANVSTNAFKRSRAVFEDLLYQVVRQPGAQSSQQTQLSAGLLMGTGVRLVSTVKNFNQGTIQQTGNALDVEIQGNGFFQVLQPDGTTAYSRDGAFQIDSQGVMVTANGFPIQPQITIPANSLSVTIGQDGIVSVQQPGVASTTQVGTIQLANFINPVGLQSIGQNLYLETASSGTPSVNTPGTNGLGILVAGALENSNVNVVEELVLMIQTQRTYEMNSRVIKTADEMLARLGQL